MKLPRFTLRDLFWLVLVCALGMGWWCAERKAQTEAELVDFLAKEMENHLQAIADAERKAGDGTTYSGYKVEVIREP